MNDMNDDTLILYYYGDGLTDAETAAVESALERDPALRERYQALSRSLDRFEPPVERAPAHVESRWHRAITNAAAAERARAARHRGAWHLPSFAWGALAAALVAAIGIGLYVAVRPPAAPSMAEGPGIDGRAAAPAAVPAAFARGLEVHLRQTRQDIARLAPNDDVDRAALIMDIVRQNRLFERTAHEHDAEDVARVLRAFEPVLLRLAGEDVSARDAAALRAQLEFELNVMLTKMQRRDSHLAELI